MQFNFLYSPYAGLVSMNFQGNGVSEYTDSRPNQLVLSGDISKWVVLSKVRHERRSVAACLGDVRKSNHIKIFKHSQEVKIGHSFN